MLKTIKKYNIMKRIIPTSTLVIFFIILLTNNALAKDKKNEKTVTFNVSMDCHNCVKKIESNIPYEKGVKDLKVSLDKKECELTYRSDKTNTETLTKAFNELGYKAEIKKDDSVKPKAKNE